MSDLLLGLFINGVMTGVIVLFAVIYGRKEDREAKEAKTEEQPLRRAG